MQHNQILKKTRPSTGRVLRATEQVPKLEAAGTLRSVLHGLREEERKRSGMRSLLGPNGADAGTRKSVQSPLE